MADEKQYKRQVQTSVTNFLYHGDEYLFLKRNESKRVDPGRLNGVGGRVEPGEDYLSAAIRETEEETGYIVSPEEITLSAIIKLEGGYSEDWVMCFFKIQVKDKNIPHGNKTEDGELIWIHKDEVLDTQYQLVDDLNYTFKEIAEGKQLIFMTAKLDENHKIYHTSISNLRQ
jgi:8-oxo-dGTP pyrophosphatase MutT (NUDIX family)